MKIKEKMIDNKQLFKVFKIDDFFKIIKLNPNVAIIKNNIEGDNKKLSVEFNLTKSKLLQTFGYNCSCCGMKGKYFIFLKNGDIKLMGITEYGMEIEIFVINKKPICNVCNRLGINKS